PVHERDAALLQRVGELESIVNLELIHGVHLRLLALGEPLDFFVGSRGHDFLRCAWSGAAAGGRDRGRKDQDSPVQPYIIGCGLQPSTNVRLSVAGRSIARKKPSRYDFIWVRAAGLTSARPSMTAAISVRCARNGSAAVSSSSVVRHGPRYKRS